MGVEPCSCVLESQQGRTKLDAEQRAGNWDWADREKLNALETLPGDDSHELHFAEEGHL